MGFHCTDSDVGPCIPWNMIFFVNEVINDAIDHMMEVLEGSPMIDFKFFLGFCLSRCGIINE